MLRRPSRQPAPRPRPPSAGALALALCAVSLVGGAAPAAASALAPSWTISAKGAWPGAALRDVVVVRAGDQLVAYALATGKRAWTRTLDGTSPAAGPALAAGPRYLYALSPTALYVVEPRRGKVVQRRKMTRPRDLMFRRGSLYVSTATGLLRLKPDATAVVSHAKGFSGQIRGADGDYVAIYTRVKPKQPRLSPKRLMVVHLGRGEKVYEFKLLPHGGHRVVRVRGGRVQFIDYSRRRGGKNPKKLYFTEADYVRSKKIKDEALAGKFPLAYPTAAADTFWVAAGAGGELVFLGNHGRPGAPSSLLAYDPAHDRVAWNRSGEVLSTGLLVHEGKLWTGVTLGDGSARAVAYHPDDGNVLHKVRLDGPVAGAPIAAGGRVLFRTRGSLVCVQVGAAPAGGQPPQATPSTIKPQRPGWRVYRDRKTGYLIEAPPTWQYDRSRVVRMGGLRKSVPFVRKETVGGKQRYLGSVHVLTYEAAGRDVGQLWQSVYTQRRRSNPDVRVQQVQRVKDVGGSGAAGIRAHYMFRDRGYPVQMRSLCVVHHGVAFEVRGWAGPSSPGQTWREIEAIFATFRPKKF